MAAPFSSLRHDTAVASSSSQLNAPADAADNANAPSASRSSSRNAYRRSSVYSDQSFYSAPDYRRRRQPRVALHPPDVPASFSFVCLGTGGGPLEGDCSCYLLKPADAQWQDGSIVVEGGSWLGALTDVLEQHGPDSAFHDFDFPATTPSAFLRAGLMASFSTAFLISHAHLDHILGLVLGSASLPASAPSSVSSPRSKTSSTCSTAKSGPSSPPGTRTSRTPCTTCAASTTSGPLASATRSACSPLPSPTASTLPNASSTYSHLCSHPAQPELL